MKKQLIVAVLFLAASTLLLSFPTAAQKKGKTRPLTTSQLMAGLVKPKLTSLKGGLEKEEIAADAWKGLATDAALLNESAYIMMADHRCPDNTWEEACKILIKSSNEALAAIDKKDAEAGQKAVAGILSSCKHCHAEFKYKKK